MINIRHAAWPAILDSLAARSAKKCKFVNRTDTPTDPRGAIVIARQAFRREIKNYISPFAASRSKLGDSISNVIQFPHYQTQ